jgi:hypothetical protein
MNVHQLQPELQRTIQDFNRQFAAGIQPALDLAAQVVAAMEPCRNALVQIAQAMRPVLEAGWIEKIRLGIQRLNDAMQNAEAMGRFGWTIPFNADLDDCLRLLADASSPQSADAAFLYFYQANNRRSLILLLGDLEQQPMLEDFKGLLQEVAFGIDKEKYRLVVTALLPTLEAVVRRCWTDDAWKAGDRRKFFEEKIRALAPDSFGRIEWTAMRAFVEGLYAKNMSSDPKPQTLNRHWVLHGRGPADGNLADCFRLLQAIHTIISLADDDQADPQEPPSHALNGSDD